MLAEVPWMESPIALELKLPPNILEAARATTLLDSPPESQVHVAVRPKGGSLELEVRDEEHGGKVRVESEPGQGAAFKVELPLAIPA